MPAHLGYNYATIPDPMPWYNRTYLRSIEPISGKNVAENYINIHLRSFFNDHDECTGSASEEDPTADDKSAMEAIEEAGGMNVVVTNMLLDPAWLFKNADQVPRKKLTGQGPGYIFEPQNRAVAAYGFTVRTGPNPTDDSGRFLLCNHTFDKDVILSGANRPFMFFFGSSADKFDLTEAATAAATFPACGLYSVEKHKAPLRYSKVRASAV